MKKTSNGTSIHNPTGSPEKGTSVYTGIVIHDGFAYGNAVRRASGFPNLLEEKCESTDEEIKRLDKAIAQAISDLDATLSGLSPESESHAIFSSHQMMLKDPILLDEVRNSIKKNTYSADFAWITALKSYYEQFKRAAKGTSMEQRTSDITDIANRVYRLLSNSGEVRDPSAGILVTEELSASDALDLDPELVKGVVTEKGNETSHSAILIRSKGIPVVFGIRDLCTSLHDNEWVAINGDTGEVYVGYDSETEQMIGQKKANYESQMDYYATQVNVKACFEGQDILLLANVSSVQEIDLALKNGAQGIGLFRTEFIYLNRSSAPSEQEQFIIYRDALKSVSGQKLVIRTADFGGDKPIPYLKWDQELNPFLGKRGIRYSLEEKTLLKTQLRAILRASAFGRIDVMFPMISTVDEVVQIKERIEQYRNELLQEGIASGELSIGVMIEVPSAALQINDILKEVDFVSIGTNDLIQYVMASDRTLDTLGELTSSTQPAVLKLIHQVIQEARNHQKDVSICGEMAGESKLTPLLLGFGLKEFSMSADRIPRVKEVVNTSSETEIGTLVRMFNECQTISQVRSLLDQAQSSKN